MSGQYEPCEHRSERPMPGVHVDYYDTPCPACQQVAADAHKPRSNAMLGVHHEEEPVSTEPVGLSGQAIAWLCVLAIVVLVAWAAS
jgi:hypothetical protein